MLDGSAQGRRSLRRQSKESGGSLPTGLSKSKPIGRLRRRQRNIALPAGLFFGRSRRAKKARRHRRSKACDVQGEKHSDSCAEKTLKAGKSMKLKASVTTSGSGKANKKLK